MNIQEHVGKANSGAMRVVAPPEPRRKTPMRPRLTMTEQIYHQEGGGKSPTGADSVAARFLASDEQPFVRKTRLGEVWIAPETGWVKTVSMLRIANHSPTYDVYPTPQERAEAESKVLEIGMDVGGSVIPFAVVRPGETIRLEPYDLSSLRARCRSGFAQVTIHAFPE